MKKLFKKLIKVSLVLLLLIFIVYIFFVGKILKSNFNYNEIFGKYYVTEKNDFIKFDEDGFHYYFDNKFVKYENLTLEEKIIKFFYFDENENVSKEVRIYYINGKYLFSTFDNKFYKLAY